VREVPIHGIEDVPTQRAFKSLRALLVDLAAQVSAGGTGPAGPTGPTGADGADGPPGPPGFDGVDAATPTAYPLDLGTDPKTSHVVTVVDGAVSPTSLITVSWGATLDTDANGPDMDIVTFAARPGTGSFDVVVGSLSPISGELKIIYAVG
jgi:hypothetical protein